MKRKQDKQVKLKTSQKTNQKVKTSNGLTSQEKKRLKELKKILQGKDKNENKPTTAQKTITFKKMYKDGICQVKSNYYTKMIELFDINYDALDEDEKCDILDNYMKVLNYFQPGIRFQYFLFNRPVNRQTLMDMFDIDMQDDSYDYIRTEFSDMLKVLSSEGNDGIIKSKFLIFGVEGNGIKEARNELENIEKDIIKNYSLMGVLTKKVDGKRRLRLIHEYFNQDTLEPFKFSFKEMSESGKSEKDYVAPSGFDFRYPTRFKAGNMFGNVCYLEFMASNLTDQLLKDLIKLNDNMAISIHMQTIDPLEAIKMVKANLSNVQKMKIDEQKKAVRGGYDMDAIPQDILAYEKDLIELLTDINTSNQKLINMTFLINCFGKSKRRLENLKQRITGIVQQSGNDVRCLQYLQEQGLMAASPIGVNDTGIVRSVTTKDAAILFPFNTQELFMSGQSLYYGLNQLSNNMIMADRKQLRTPNGVILGTPGSGKSFSAKREILGCFLMTKDDVLICDPEGEYFPLVQALNGQVIRLATNSTDYLNPMDIQINQLSDTETLRLKSDFLISLCDLIAGEKAGLTADEKGIVDQCVENVYEKFLENPVPENMPILQDLYDELISHENPKAQRIANCLYIYVHGTQNYFNHRTNVDSTNRIICFDIKELGSQLKKIGMMIVQDAVWNRVAINRERRIATRYYCDEFHLLIRDKQTATYNVEIWKRFRKWGGIPTALTQNVSDFLRSPEVEGILGNSDFVYLLNQSRDDQKILAEKLHLSDEQLKYVTNSEQGSGLIKYDNIVIPFIDNYPTDTKTYAIMTTKPEESIQKDEERIY